MNSDAEFANWLLNKNKEKLAKSLLDKLTELKIPFLVGDNNYPIMLNKDDGEKSKEIYKTICLDFLADYEKKNKKK